MIIFAYGADTFRSRRWIQELKNKFTRDIDPLAQSLNIIDGQTTTLKEINEKVNTGSLFVKKRLTVIENIFKNKKSDIFTGLIEYLKKLSAANDNIIIFRDEELNTKEKPLRAEAKKLFTFLTKQPYAQEFAALNNSQLLSFIKKETSAYQKNMDLAGATKLISLTSGDLWIISNEIKKLANYTATDSITSADVEKMVAGAYDENIFALTDAISAKNKGAAATLLEEQYAAGLSDEYLLTMLIRQFKILLQIRSAIDSKTSPADIATKLRLHPFVVKKGLLQAKNFSATELKNHLNYLINLDFLNKTGQANIKTKLILLISSL